MGRLEQKVAIVTGAASGIGKASALLFAQENAKLMLADIRDQAGQEVEGQISRQKGCAYYLHADVSRADDVGRLVTETVAKFGKLDILFANAGIDGPLKPLADLTEEEWDHVLDTNLKSAFLCAKVAIPHMLARGGGSIIFTGSVNSLVAEPGCPAYCASKGGVLMLAKAIAVDYGKQNIRANVICPSFVRTPLMEDWLARQENPEGARAVAYRRVVINRFAEPEEIAQAALFLASDESSYVTGTALLVDGGFTAEK